jgi:stress response protein YsnF
VTGTTDAATLGDAFRERTVEVTETAEEAVVDKRARVVEEVVVRKGVDERVEQIDDTVRRTEVDIDDQRGVDRLAARDPSLDQGTLGSTPTDRDRLR